MWSRRAQYLLDVGPRTSVGTIASTCFSSSFRPSSPSLGATTSSASSSTFWSNFSSKTYILIIFSPYPHTWQKSMSKNPLHPTFLAWFASVISPYMVPTSTSSQVSLVTSAPATALLLPSTVVEHSKVSRFRENKDLICHLLCLTCLPCKRLLVQVIPDVDNCDVSLSNVITFSDIWPG